MKITAAQTKTLRTLIARGGEMNSWAGQPGFYINSTGPLIRAGLIESVNQCTGCVEHGVFGGRCERPLTGQRGGGSCYGRVRITDAGRAAAN